MKQGPIGRIVVLVVTIVVVASACGDDDAATTSTTQQATSTTTVASSTTTVASSTTNSSTSTVPEETESVSVFFSTGDGSDCSEVEEFERQVPVADDAIRAVFDQLVAGPTDDEQAVGASSFFSADTIGTVRNVTLQDGLLVVDFEDLSALIPNASTSCGSEALLAQLNTTAFQHPDVLSVRYEIAGDCDAFANWLQRECQESEPEA
jgi:spore germination protein GerM